MGAPRYPSSCVERFLEYVSYDTQSAEGATSYPSTAKQLVLLRRLLEQLQELGVEDATMDEHGYVFGTVPSTSPKTDVPTIGFIAHVDTSPEMSGCDVKPIVHRDYQGQDLILPDDPHVVIRASEHPELARQIGRDVITASGRTLLGADNKVGVAEIMGAVEYLMAHPEIPHGPVRVGFTPDEEVGQGTKFFDVARFGALCAYTMDGEALGQLQIETFSADSMTLTFRGHNTHPGYARGKMVNAIKLVADFLERLPRESLSPETTSGYEGYVHPYVLHGGVDEASIKLLIRDFETRGLSIKENLIRELADQTVAAYPRARVDIEVQESYRNMREVLDRYPQVVSHAEEAMRRAGVEVRSEPIRGGTDGSRLSFMGLPTPNLFAGEHAFHSREEWTSTYEMHKAVEVIVELCRVWEERSGG
jgi:tripeptide aminopeptidase